MPSSRRQISAIAGAFVGGRASKSRDDPLRAVDEQPDGFERRDGRQRPATTAPRASTATGAAEAARPSIPRPSRLVTSSAQLALGRQQAVGHAGHVVEQVLAVVENEQGASPATMLGDGVAGDPCRPTREPASAAATASTTRLASGDGSEVDEPDAVGERRQQVLRQLQREARLAAAADAGQREHARVAEQSCALGELALAADEVRPLAGQVVPGSDVACRRRRRRGPADGGVASASANWAADCVAVLPASSPARARNHACDRRGNRRGAACRSRAASP